MDGLSPSEDTFSVLRAAPRTWSTPSFSAVLSLLPSRDSVHWGCRDWKQGRLHEALDINKPYIHSSFINSPTIYPWFLVARHNQSCGVEGGWFGVSIPIFRTAALGMGGWGMGHTVYCRFGLCVSFAQFFSPSLLDNSNSC